MKGLPLAYSKDLQEDKEATFAALDALSLCIAAMRGMVADLQPDAETMLRAAGNGYATATDLADWLVRTLKIPFREAHHLTGRIVADAEAKGLGLEQLTLADLTVHSPHITKEVFSILSPQRSVASRTSYGGTAPQNVRKMARKWIKRLERRGGRG
jgi:argininosuccinate lyase